MSGKAFAFALIVLVSLFGCTRTDSADTVAKDFTLLDLNGKTVRLSDFRGRPVLLDFWATWCPPCRESIPGIERLHRRYSGKGLAVLGIATDGGGWDDVKAFVSTYGMTYTVLKASDEVLFNYRVRTIPLLVLLNKEGKIVKRYLGFVSEEDVDKDVQSIL